MQYSKPWMLFGLSLIAIGFVMLLRQDRSPMVLADAADEATSDKFAWQELFDGKTLTGWKVPKFGGEGEVKVEDGAIILSMGSAMTGITWTGDPPRTNYELELEGKRITGSDFFCTTTFPVGKDYCSFVVGGWGGCVVGLSSIDYADASENSTSKTKEFKENQWYKIRIRVTDVAIQAWIDDQEMVYQPRKDHKIDIRIEVSDCRPLGISSWYTTGAVRNIRLRQLRPEEVAAAVEFEKKRAAAEEAKYR